MPTKKISLFVLIIFFLCADLFAGQTFFSIRKFSPNEFSVFQKVFAEMRGPLRTEIMKDKKTDFENADPLKYIIKIRDTKDVKKVLKKNDLSWEQFNDLMANVLMVYFSVQPNKTKAALVKQLADYGYFMSADQIPEEYRGMVSDALKTNEGSALAGAVFDMVVQIPPENIAIVRKNEKQLDRDFYTKHWRDSL